MAADQSVNPAYATAAINAGYLAASLFALLVYEYLITLNEEIRLFWSGRWTLSRMLFHINRYLPLVSSFVVAFLQLDFMPRMAFHPPCTNIVRATYVLTVVSFAAVQAVLAIRLWYLFPKSIALRIFVVFGYFGCLLSASVIVGVSSLRDLSFFPAIPGWHDGGCFTPIIRRPWIFFTPSFILHTVFYLLILYRATLAEHDAPVIRRLSRDGGLFYLVVVVSFGFTTFATISSPTAAPALNVPASFSNLVVAMTGIATARAMLSIHSLAANLHTDPSWLLSHAELSRVRWKTGRHDRELIVDVN